MKASWIQLTLAFATGVFAEPIPIQPPTKVQRDLATVTSVMAQVSAAITTLDTDVQAFSGDPTQVDADVTNLVSVIEAGTAIIAASSNLTVSEALNLATTVVGIQTVSEALVSDLTAQKAAFEQIGHCAAVQAGITEIGAQSANLIDATVSKVPALVQAVAAELAAGINAALASGAAAYATCNDVVSSTSSSMTSTSTSTSATSTSTSSTETITSTSTSTSETSTSTSETSTSTSTSSSTSSTTVATTTATSTASRTSVYATSTPKPTGCRGRRPH